MRVWVILCLFAGCSPGVSSEKIRAPQGHSANPVNETTDGPVHDFGSMLSGDRKQHRFEIVNTSSVDAKIGRVSTSCSCTVASFTESAVPAGGAFHVDVEFHAPAAPGRISKTVSVYFTAEAIAPVRLTTTAEVRAPLSVMPSSGLVIVGGDEQQTLEFQVSNYTTLPPVDLAVKGLPGFVVSSVQPLLVKTNSSSAPNSAWLVQMQIDGRKLPDCGAKFIASFDLTGKGVSVDVPVEVRRQKTVSIVPAKISLSPVDVNVWVPFRFVLRYLRSEGAKQDTSYHVGFFGENASQFEVKGEWDRVSASFMVFKGSMRVLRTSTNSLNGMLRVSDGANNKLTLDIPVAISLRKGATQ